MDELSGKVKSKCLENYLNWQIPKHFCVLKKGDNNERKKKSWTTSKQKFNRQQCRNPIFMENTSLTCLDVSIIFICNNSEQKDKGKVHTEQNSLSISSLPVSSAIFKKSPNTQKPVPCTIPSHKCGSYHQHFSMVTLTSHETTQN